MLLPRLPGMASGFVPRRTRRTLGPVLIGALLAALAAPGTVAAQSSPNGPATRFLKRHHDQINRTLRRAARTEAAREARRNEVTEIIRSLLDLDSMGRAALGSHWNDHSEAERSEFLDILRQLVEGNYRRNLEGTKNYRVRYLEETGEEPQILVRTSARDTRNRRAPAVEISYTVTQDGDAYRVVDITTDGVSMVRNYRSQFGRIIRRDGWPALIDRMRTRLAEQRD